MFEVYAIHKLSIAEGGEVEVEEIGAAVADDLPVRNREVFSAFVDGMVNRDEGLGKAQSAWWIDGIPKELAELRTCDLDDFDVQSRAAMARLRASTPGTATGGVVVFVRTVEDEEPRLLCMKLVLSDLSLERFTGALSATTAIAVEDISGVLPKPSDLKKAALIPHPAGAADLKVVDEQAREAADYWLRFLGARVGVKEPDVGRLVASAIVPVLEERDVDDAPLLVANELKRVAAATKAESVKTFVKRVAEAAETPPTDVWAAVGEREPKLREPRVKVSPAAAQRVRTEIVLPGGIKISGLSTELGGRYNIIRDPKSDGWIVQVFTPEFPTIRHRNRPGRIVGGA